MTSIPRVHPSQRTNSPDTPGWINEPPAVKAVLVRTGLVLVGSQPVSSGLYSIPRAENYSITGVNEFGRRIIRELQETETN